MKIFLVKEIYKYLKLKIFKQNIEEEFPFKLKGLEKKNFVLIYLKLIVELYINQKLNKI